MTLPPLLSYSFWSNPVPLPFTPVFSYTLLVISIVLAVFGAGVLVWSMRTSFDKITRRAVGNAGASAIWVGLAGLLLYAFEYEGVPYLSMRVWWVFWFVWLVWAVWSHWKTFTKTIPETHAARAERERLEKWLPKGSK